MDWLSQLSAPVPQAPRDPVADGLAEFLKLAEHHRGPVSLDQFIPQISPGYESPLHLAPLIRVLERAHREPVRVVCHAPPRHGKTCSVQAAVAWYLTQNPKLTCGYATYGADLSYSKSREMRALARAAGVELASDAQGVKEWRTRAGGGLLATGVGGPFTGFGVNILFVDDPFKNRIEAESATQRGRVLDWWQSVARTRMEPNGSAVVFACMTGDTPVTMGDGTRKPLESVRAGDDVLAWKNGAQVVRKVLAWVPQGEDDILEMRTGNHRVRGNARHPFLVSRDGVTEWVKLGDVKKGDRLVCSGLEPWSETPRLSEVQAWFLGFMFGDGWVTINKKLNKKPSGVLSPTQSYCTCAAVSIDPVLNARVVTTFEECFGVTPKLTKFGYIRTEVARVGKWLLAHGMNGKARTKRVPPWMFSQPLNVRREFLAGFLAADGHVTKHGRHSVHICNLHLANDLRHLARSCGHAAGNVHARQSNGQAPNSPEPTVAESIYVSWQPETTNEPFGLATVRSVKPAGRAEVFDLQVEDAECFVADGLVSHNTRWHPDDLSGELIRQGWEYIRLPAISDAGDALWPARYDVKALDELRRDVGEYTWASLYQGLPRPRGGSVFHSDVKTYSPKALEEVLKNSGGWRKAIGVDCAYSKRTSADHTALVAGLGFTAEKRRHIYVLEVVRKQIEAPGVALEGKLLQAKHGNCPAMSYVAGPEKGVAGLMHTMGFRLDTKPAVADKFTRAQPYAATWNDGRVLVPEDAGPTSWVNVFLAEHLNFTGSDDKEDDQIDAGASMHDLLNVATETPRGVGTKPLGFFY